MASHGDRAPASTAAIAIGSALVAGVTGYFLGQAKSIGLFGGYQAAHSNAAQPDESESEEEEEEEDEVQELKAFDGNEECKLVLVVRTDLGMTKGEFATFFRFLSLRGVHLLIRVCYATGKIAAQCGHATLACYKSFLRSAPESPLLQRWERGGQMKVALQVKSEEELEVLQAQALSLGLCARIIHDAGRTQIASGSATVLGIGPAPKSLVDKVTGHLKLL